MVRVAAHSLLGRARDDAGDDSADEGAPDGADTADDDHHEGQDQRIFAHAALGLGDRRYDHAGETGENLLLVQTPDFARVPL